MKGFYVFLLLWSSAFCCFSMWALYVDGALVHPWLGTLEAACGVYQAIAAYKAAKELIK